MIKTEALIIAGLLPFLFVGGKAVTRPTLQYFSASEFGIWYPLMSAELLKKLDEFREQWGAPVQISPANGAIGRRHGDGNESQHNVTRWGEVRAIDVFPMVSNGAGGWMYMRNLVDRKRAFQLARQVGFTGIGIYTDTSPGNLLHIDVREGRTPGDPAKWARVDGKFLDINTVIA